MAPGWNTGATCRLLSALHSPWVLWRGVFECHSVIAKQERQQKTQNKQTTVCSTLPPWSSPEQVALLTPILL